jgi:hypothetical protein
VADLVTGVDGPDWRWLKGPDYELMGCLVFARGAAPERVLQAFGLDPAAARTVSADQLAHEAADLASGPPAAVGVPVRVGRQGEWAFAIDLNGPAGPVDHAAAVRRLSTGTEAVLVEWTPKPFAFVDYWADGTLTTWFDVRAAYRRAGADPDRFLREMRAVGLRTEVVDAEVDRVRVLEERARILEARRKGIPIEVFDPFVAALDMLTLALGITLPADVAEGPLLTAAQPDPPQVPPQVPPPWPTP